MAIVDRDSRLLAVNDALCALLGAPRSALLGRFSWEFLDALEASPWRGAMQLLPDTAALRRSLRLQRLDGQTRAIDATLTDLGDYLAQLVLHDVSAWREIIGQSCSDAEASIA